MTIIITTQHPASFYGVPVCLIDGNIVNDPDGLRACMRALNWTRSELATASGKSVAALDQYLAGRQPVPAEVWNTIKDAIEKVS